MKNNTSSLPGHNTDHSRTVPRACR